MKLFWQGCQLAVSDHFGGCQIANIRIKKKLLYSKTSNTSYLKIDVCLTKWDILRRRNICLHYSSKNAIHHDSFKGY